MKMSEKFNGDELILKIEGVFDESTAFTIRDKMNDLLEKNIQTLYLDLDHIGYISSIGIGVLITAHKNAVKKNKRVLISSISEKANEMLKAVGILPLFAGKDK